MGAQPWFRISRRFMGPSWLTGAAGTKTQRDDGQLLGWTLDALKDAFTERLREGLLVRFPQWDPTGTPGPADALAAIGRDRVIVRGIGETTTSYAARLIQWLNDWAVAGNPFALMKQLAGFTGPGPSFRTVDVRGNWFSRDASGNLSVVLNKANWDWDGSPTALQRWSRFWVIIYPNGLWEPSPAWGSPGLVYGTPGQTWGSTATTGEVNTIQGIVSTWKPAGTRCVNIILAFDPTSFNPETARDSTGLPDGLWGHWSTSVSGQRVPSRLSTARYWDGV
jgi:hypothetical protein